MYGAYREDSSGIYIEENLHCSIKHSLYEQKISIDDRYSTVGMWAGHWDNNQPKII